MYARIISYAIHTIYLRFMLDLILNLFSCKLELSIKNFLLPTKMMVLPIIYSQDV